MKKLGFRLFWLAVALAGAWAYATLALHRGERLNSAYLLIAALCSYAIGYRFYSKWIAVRVLMLNDRRATPCEVHDDGKDFVKTNKWIVFGHHFAAISGPGPLVGPVLAAQFGYLPGTLWILIGVVLGGAVQDFVVLFASLRRDGKSLGQMVKEELNTTAGYLALVAILAIMVILLAVLALVVVKALAESPWGVFTVGATIPIALFMGCYLRFGRIGKVMEASAIGVALLLLAVWGGKYIYGDPFWSKTFSLEGETLAWLILTYGFAASVLPVWLLLAPRDYLSTFMKLGTIFALAAGIFLVLPSLKMPAVTTFIDGSGLVVPGRLFPFCFITIACGAISGFHTLIASGTTPKLVTRESYARPIGYGAMCLESLVAIMAMIAACTLDPGVYLGMNVASTGADPAAKAASITRKIQAAGAPFVVRVEEMEAMAAEVKEKTLFNRAGGAATLAAGMASIFANATKGRWLDLWYHFAIMFEALFILTTLDAGTRVGRYILQDFLGGLWRPLADTKSLGANMLASGLMVGGWGYFLIQGVRDPLGGVNSLWPLFGIANQMLAGIALCLATTIILKMTLQKRAGDEAQNSIPPRPDEAGVAKLEVRGPKFRIVRPVVALITLGPLAWLLAVTMTAGVQKIWHPDKRIGFLAAARSLNLERPALELALVGAKVAGETQAMAMAEKALRANRLLHFNNLLDAVVAGVFLVLVAGIAGSSVREWMLLLGRRKPAVLRESEAAWLPEYALAETKPLRVASILTLGMALAKELSGEAQMERGREAVALCECAPGSNSQRRAEDAALSRSARQRRYAEMTEQRFTGVRRCC
jgi:carbon starvation protein